MNKIAWSNLAHYLLNDFAVPYSIYNFNHKNMKLNLQIKLILHRSKLNVVKTKGGKN